MGGIEQVADGISGELRRRLPGQRKTQQENLAPLVATMLEARSANLMELAAALPRAAERIDMRVQRRRREPLPAQGSRRTGEQIHARG